ncbi:MAG: histidine--tRNA ligase [Acidobacteria bacterium]|nr:histidine--tRNA ligase [Acidobacteriota bacterium]MBU1474451.1 histidine--tRNA ligase [Acidobacteriota bacterium]MBU2439062.1 histidine--tRNA ligase [Acidobacteriota bacterium]
MSESERKKSIQSIKGTKDILPDEVWMWQKLEEIAGNLFERYGYRQIRTPVFEATELFEKGTGETSDIVTKEMYSFRDKGGRDITLRPEYTPSVVRSIIEHRLHLRTPPLRFYYFGPMFRYDKPQKGRYRQFHQIDVEVFNEKDAAIDAELVEMAQQLLIRLGVKDIHILVNSVGCTACRPSYHQHLRKSADQARENLCKDCRRKIDTNPLRLFDCKEESCRKISEGFPLITDHLCQECRDHFLAFCAYLDELSISYLVESRLVRGLDYYTKTTFEFTSGALGAQDAILGGGRYDDMMKQFGGPDICGTGFAVGIERLLSAASLEENKREWLYIATLGAEARITGMKLARELRAEGWECLIEYRERSLNKQLGRAHKLGAGRVVLIGDEEVRSGRVQLKNMSSGQQTDVSVLGLAEALNVSD